MPKGAAARRHADRHIGARLDETGNIQGFLIGGPQPGRFAIKRRTNSTIRDGALMPGGDLLILERRYSLLRGVAMRIRRIPLVDIKPGALVDGPVLIVADIGYQIDNMEGMSAHRTASGETVLTLFPTTISPPIQRTMLLQFTLVEE